MVSGGWRKIHGRRRQQHLLVIVTTVVLSCTSVHGFAIASGVSVQHNRPQHVALAARNGEDDFVPVGRRRRRPYYDEEEATEDDYAVSDEYLDDEEDDYYYEDDDADDDSIDPALQYLEEVMNDWEESADHELLANVVLPNPLLDNMDPDGAADRAPELLRDPRFWFDLFLFVMVMDFLSWVGPQNPNPFN